MTKNELLDLAEALSQEESRRQALGDYSQEASGIRFLYQAVLLLTQHLAAKEKK